MNKYYIEFTDVIKRYQKSEKYKSYRRKYEEGYRDRNRVMVNFLSWKSNHVKRMTPQKEMNYLLKRFLND
jgi:hypothetical protein